MCKATRPQLLPWEPRPWNKYGQWCLDEVSRRENDVDLLLGTASTADYPSVSVEICSSVAGVVSRPLAAGLWQFDIRRHFITSLVTAAVSDERRQSADLFLVKVPAHHSALKSAALAGGSRADCIQTSSPRIQVSTQVYTWIPYRQALSRGKCRLRSSLSLSLIVSHTWLPTVGDSFPRCRCSCLEQSARSCHFRTFRSMVLKSVTGIHFLRCRRVELTDG